MNVQYSDVQVGGVAVGRGQECGARSGMLLLHRLVRESLAEKVTLGQRVKFSG